MAVAASRREDRDRNQPVVLVTGCSEGGIGHAMVRAFAAAGCAVVATARSRGSMRDLDGDPRFLLLELDVRSDESARAAVADALREHGRVDVLVNNAGVHLVAPLAEVPMESFHQVFDTNVYGRIKKMFFLFCLLSTALFAVLA
jgi:NAD(P)-dependent dehydrogenase (short-subunit alcohol dehydrogenase family)